MGSSTGTVLCTVHYTPAHWEKFYYLSLHLISGLSPLIWDQGLTGTGVTPSANQRPVLPPVTNERPASGDWTDPWCLTPGLPPLSWAGVATAEVQAPPPGPGCTGSTEFVLVSSAQLKMRIRGLNQLSSRPASTLPLNNPTERNNRSNPL